MLRPASHFRSFILACCVLLSSASVLRAQSQSQPILDGATVSESVYPFVARLSVDGELLCTGTLVGSRYVLTAAHCFFDENNRRAVGNTDVVARMNGQEYSSTKVTIHPNYRSRSSACVEGETDAAVVELSSDVSVATPIELLDSPAAVGTSLILVGYGTQGPGSTGEDGTIPPVGFVNVGPTVIEGYGDNPPQQKSSSSYFYWSFDPGESNTGSGDSGGPAFYQTTTQNFLAGITCGGDGNAEFGTTSFDTRADLIKSWVLSITGGSPSGSAPGFPKLKTQSAALGQAFSMSISATGTAPISLEASGLPAGLSLSGSTISGTPTESGRFTVTLTATNSLGSASTNFVIVVSGFDPALSVRKVLLQFDSAGDGSDFLDISGNVAVGSKFNPNGKRVTVQIGRFTKQFRLTSSGASNSNNHNFFDLVGAMSGRTFKKSSVRYNLTIESRSLFEELSTLGFPESSDATQGEQVSLPLSVTLNGVEASTTTVLTFRSSDSRWRN